MSAKKNKDLVLKFYHLMSALEFDAMFDLMADNAVWTVAGKPELFHHAGKSSKAQRIEAFSNFTKAFKSLEMDVVSATAEDDRVAIEVISRCKTLGGLNYENEMLILLRCANDRIVSIYEHLDPLRTIEFEKKMATSSA